MASFLREELWKHDYESDALTLAKAARIVRCEMFNQPGFHFLGNFPSNCQISSVPSCLRALILMLLNGSNIAHRSATESQATLTISQQIVFNSKKKSSTTSSNRHSLEREPPLLLYVGLSIHAYTRSKKIINELFQLGISASYNRVDDLMNGLGTAVCNRFQQDGVVCPLYLNCGLFTVGALDNIDYNPSSTTAERSFHGTWISLFQFPSSSVDGTQSRLPITLPLGKPDRNIHLPESYTTVPAVSVKTTELAVSKTAYTEAFLGNLQQAMAQEDCWAQHALSTVDKEVRSTDVITWSSYHGSMNRPPCISPVISGLLPLSYEKAFSLAMVKHGMEMQRQATAHLNPGQIPVTANTKYQMLSSFQSNFLHW